MNSLLLGALKACKDSTEEFPVISTRIVQGNHEPDEAHRPALVGFGHNVYGRLGVPEVDYKGGPAPIAVPRLLGAPQFAVNEVMSIR
jgi:hypothetical protein